MDPSLDKRLQMTEGGEMRGNFNVYLRTATSDKRRQRWRRANLIAISSTSLFSVVQVKVFQHTEQPWPAGNWKNIVFSHTLTEEDGNLLWDGTNDNPIIEVTMKVKGD